MRYVIIVRYLEHKIRKEVIDFLPKTLSEQEAIDITEYIMKYALNKVEEVSDSDHVNISSILKKYNIDVVEFDKYLSDIFIHTKNIYTLISADNNFIYKII